jgi:hypothetical protein
MTDEEKATEEESIFGIDLDDLKCPISFDLGFDEEPKEAAEKKERSIFDLGF